MGHFARVENGVVTRIIVAEQDFIDTLDDKDLWFRTSYNTEAGVHALGGEPYRKNYARIGYIFDPERDAFIPPQPYASWTLNEETCQWDPPVPKPSPSFFCQWDEEKQEWLMPNLDESE